MWQVAAKATDYTPFIRQCAESPPVSIHENLQEIQCRIVIGKADIPHKGSLPAGKGNSAPEGGTMRDGGRRSGRVGAPGETEVETETKTGTGVTAGEIPMAPGLGQETATSHHAWKWLRYQYASPSKEASFS